MKHLFIEIKRFFKKYIKSILLVSILLTAVFSVLYLSSTDNTSEEDEQTGALSDPELHDGNAYFKFYIEDENQLAFTNTVLLNQFIRLEENLSSISENTNTDLLEAYEEQKVSLELNPTDTVPVIEIRRDNQSQLMTLYSRLDNPEDNIRVANYLFDQLSNNNVPVLEDKAIYLFTEPNLFEEPEESATPKDVFSSLNIVETALVIIILFFLSIILMIAFFLLKEMFSKKLNFSFAYTTDESTEFALYSKELENTYEISKFLSAPGFTEKLLIHQNDVSQLKTIYNDMSAEEPQDTLNIDTTVLYSCNTLENREEMKQISELVIVVESEETDRKWFNEQKKVASLYNKPVKVLQINR